MKEARRSARRGAAAFVAGLLFALGLAVGGMTLPSKVIGFLDVTGDWDASSMLVMAGAIAVHAIVYRLVLRRGAPLLAERLALPTRRDLDARLISGAAIFGVGWGLGGYCPGPGVASLASGTPAALVFVLSMLGATWLTARVEKTLQAASLAKPRSAQTGAEPGRGLSLPRAGAPSGRSSERSEPT